MPKAPNILEADIANLEKPLEVLQAGGVLIHATETCYGLTCDATNTKAIAKVFAIKNRPTTQPVSLLVESIDQAKTIIEWNDTIDSLAVQYWPGALTIIGKAATNTNIYTMPNATGNSIAVRVSSHPLVQALLSQFGSPIVTTSANLHGKPEPYSVPEILAQYVNNTDLPDLIVDSGILAKKKPSTIVDCSGDQVIIVRQGEIKV